MTSTFGKKINNTMNPNQFRLYLAFLATILTVGILWIGASNVQSQKDVATEKKEEASNGRYKQIDVMKYSAGKIYSDAPSYFDTRTGTRK
jgi:hypothetical protein